MWPSCAGLGAFPFEDQALAAFIVTDCLDCFPALVESLSYGTGICSLVPHSNTIPAPRTQRKSSLYLSQRVTGSMGLTMNRRVWLSSCWIGWAWFAGHRLRNTTFFGGDGLRTVRFLNLWLANLAQGLCFRAIAALASATNIRHGCKMPVLRRPSRAGHDASQKN